MSESTSIPRATIEKALPWGPVVRGVRWGEGQMRVLFLHEPEPGTDLDAWRTLPHDIARALPVETWALDLPGHGLSNDSWEPERQTDVIRELAFPEQKASRTVLVVAGGVALPAFGLAAEGDYAGLVCLSPTGESGAAVPRSPSVPKHFFAGSQAGADLEAARRLAAACGGWAVVTAVPVAARGTALLETEWGQRIAEAIASFIRDCLRGRSQGVINP